MKIQVTTEVEAPEGATHYWGDLLDDPTFVKCTQIGCVGDHWWSWAKDRGLWIFVSHHKPHWLKEIKPQTTEKEQRGEDKA